MNLYRCTNKIGNWWVVATHPTEAQMIIEKHLDNCDYGFRDSRKVTQIDFIASMADDDRFITGHFLLLKKEI